MATMQEIVERAFRKLSVLSVDTDIDADSLAHGLLLLNDMMFGWEIFGIDIEHTTLAAGDTFPLEDKFIEGTAMQLAERLSPDYQVPAPSADAFFRQLQAAYLVIAAAEIPTTLRKTSSQRRWYES